MKDTNFQFPRVVLFTNHYLTSRNKASFHWLADAFWRAGWDVLFCTESLSFLSWLRGDRRFAYPLFRQAFRVRLIRERLASYVWLTPFHPIHLRSASLNRLFAPLMRCYGKLPLGSVTRFLRQADLFLFDSDHGLFLFDRVKHLNPKARFVYRVSDDLPTMQHAPVVVEQETRVAPLFDLVSVPSPSIYKRLGYLPNVELHHHGLRKELFDQPYPNPYQSPSPNVLFVGRHRLDILFLQHAADIFPDWTFHIFGPFADLPKKPNVVSHGERSFEELLPYLRHADIGLQTLTYSPGAECFTDSLKVQQYTYCQLPIVAPAFLRCPREHMFYYDPGHRDSIRTALLAARAFDRQRIRTEDVPTWDGLASLLWGKPLSTTPTA